MLTRDAYIAILEKRAAEEHFVDNQDVAHDEYAANMSDNKDYLKGIFDNAKSVEQQQTKHVGKLFPGKEKKESGQVLLKVARQLFNEALENAQGGLIKTAEPYYQEVAFRSFVSELEKIAAFGNLKGVMPGMGIRQALQTGAAGNAVSSLKQMGVGGGNALNIGGRVQTPSLSAAPVPIAKQAALKSQTLAQVAAKNQVAMSRPAKVWNIGGGSGMGGATQAAAKSLPEGSGTSMNQSPGFFSRMFNR